METPSVELLSPAGNYEKMCAAIRFGADAVYLAGKRFGMRANADNFSEEELFSAARFCHERGKKLYLTVNITPRYYEFDDLENYLRSLRGSGIDALIIADPAVLELAKECLPEAAIHISTQAGVVSPRDADFWHRQGASRVVLARELSFDDIAAIRRDCSRELELEAFIHGSMCVSFSGRCLLSEHLIGRDANRGMCAQPCRWNYRLYEIEEEKRPGLRFPVEESDRGSFILSSKDLCMIEQIPALMESGVRSFKIEGRMKSAYYTAVTANAYRMAIDAYLRDPAGYTYDPLWMDELCSVSHREYCRGYYLADPRENAQLVTTPGYIREKAYLAIVESYDERTRRAVLIQRNKLTEGERCELLTPGRTGRQMVAVGLQNEAGEPIPATPHPYMRFSMEMPFPVREGDILRGANADR